MDDEDCGEIQYDLSFGVTHNSNGSIDFIPCMSSCADTRIAQVDAESGGCADLTDLLFVPLLSIDDDDCDEQKCSSFAVTCCHHRRHHCRRHCRRCQRCPLPYMAPEAKILGQLGWV
jgi:hypothetical protein